MFLHFKGMKSVMFPSEGVLKQSLPKVFRSFKNVRCSVHCPEFFCQAAKAILTLLTNITAHLKH